MLAISFALVIACSHDKYRKNYRHLSSQQPLGRDSILGSNNCNRVGGLIARIASSEAWAPMRTRKRNKGEVAHFRHQTDDDRLRHLAFANSQMSLPLPHSRSLPLCTMAIFRP
eukprot:3890562-Pleurochrysis_carterae.AAC.2